MSDVKVSGGPSGIRTLDRRIKSQWLQLQNSRKTAGKTQVSGHFPPKEYTCANVATVRALTPQCPRAKVNRDAVVAC